MKELPSLLSKEDKSQNWRDLAIPENIETITDMISLVANQLMSRNLNETNDDISNATNTTK